MKHIASVLRRSGWMAVAGMLLVGCAAEGPAARKSDAVQQRIPVILDTDTGNDIDDTWALAMLLKSPRFDLKLVTTTDGRAEQRAKCVAKVLQAAGRTDIPIGMGAGEKKGDGKMAGWVKDFDLAKYPGKVERDGVRALIDLVKGSDRPVTVIAIGPLQTLAAVVDRDPSVLSKIDLVGMQGSVFKGYNGAAKAQPEYNVKQAVAAAQKVLGAKWRSVAITPLDTCGLKEISIDGERYKKLEESGDPVVRAVLDAYSAYEKKGPEQLHGSTVLFDTVAVYLADPGHRELLEIRPLRIGVRDDGMTVVEEGGMPMEVATGWRDVEGYRDYLMGVLLGAGAGGEKR